MTVKKISAKKIVSTISIAFALAGCEQPPEPTDSALVQVSPAELQLFISQVKNNLVHVQGGEFLMGDFGAEYGRERAYYDEDNDSKPLHQVELSSFSINRFKVTNAEYQFYLNFNGLRLRDKGTTNKKNGTI